MSTVEGAQNVRRPFDVLSLTLMETAIGVMVMRNSRVSCEEMAMVLRTHGEVAVTPADVRLTRDGMVERQLFLRHPGTPDAYLPSPRAELLLWGGFCGLLGVFDEGRGHIEAGFIWSLITRRAPNELDG